MSDLLGTVIAAHDGRERWSELDAVSARLTQGGPLSGLNGQQGGRRVRPPQWQASRTQNRGCGVANGATMAANKRRIREFIRRAFNEHDASAIADTFAPDIQWHGGILGTIDGPEGMTDLLTKFVERCRT